MAGLMQKLLRVLSLALIAAGWLGAAAWAQQPTLVPIPQPALDLLEPEVRDHLASSRRSIDAVLADKDGGGAGKLAPADAYGELGAIYLAYRLHGAASACFANASALAPQDLRWAYLGGITAQEKGDLVLAARELNRSLALEPSYAVSHLRLGEIELSQGRLEAARALFEQAAKAPGTRAAALFGLGRVAAAEKAPERAVPLFEQALVLAPEATAIHYPLGLALRATGRNDEAAAHLAKRGEGEVAFQDPMLATIEGVRRGAVRHLERARQAEGEGKLDEAEREFQAAAKADAGNEAAWAGLARLRMGRGEANKALEAMQRLVEVAPGNAQYHASLGDLLLAAGRVEAGLEARRKAVELAPGEASFGIGYGAALAAQGRAEEAAAAYGKVAESEPKNPLAHLGRARAQLRLGREEEARNVLERAVAALPQDGDVAHLLARVLATAASPELRDGRRAFELAAQVFTAQPIADHGQTLAMAFAEQGRFKEALELQLAVIGELEAKKAPAAAIDRARRRLALYAQDQPCRTPWLE